jgi:methionyl-tRNA formyltransferase
MKRSDEMKVIFMGTPDFAVGTLKSLIASEHEVTAVVTQPDKPKGRGKAMQFPPVKEVAVEAGIPVLQPRRVREPETVEAIRNIEADVIVVVAFGQIIPKEILTMKKYGCINVHASLLPKYRGAAPIQWAVIDGEKESGVTTMQMDEGLDTGDMLLKAVVPLEKEETGGSLFDKLSSTGAGLLLETLAGLEKGTILPEKQGESPTAYAKMLKKEMGLIDWTKSAEELERLVRGLNPWPSAYSHLNGKTLKIWQAEVEERDSENEPGTVVCVSKDGFGVQTGKGILKIRELQLEGKKRMDAGAFLRGYRMEEGMKLCY